MIHTNGWGRPDDDAFHAYYRALVRQKIEAAVAPDDALALARNLPDVGKVLRVLDRVARRSEFDVLDEGLDHVNPDKHGVIPDRWDTIRDALELTVRFFDGRGEGAFLYLLERNVQGS